MRLRRSPVELLRARTMPVWPLWVLVIAVPALHILLVTQWFADATPPTDGSPDLTEVYQLYAIFAVVIPEAIALTIALTVWAWYHYFRRDISRIFLAGNGWRYKRGAMPAPQARHTAFPRPRPRKLALNNVAWGPVEDHICSSYTVWTSKVHRYSVERVELPADIPAVVIVPLDWIDRVAQGLEFAPFAVESAEFNERWRVITADARIASAVLHPRMLEHLLSDRFDGSLGVTVGNAAVTVWSPGVVDPLDVPWRLAAARSVAGLVPDFVFTQFGTPRPAEWGPASVDLWAGSGGDMEIRTKEALAAAAVSKQEDEILASYDLSPAELAAYRASVRSQTRAREPELFQAASGSFGYCIVVGFGALTALMMLLLPVVPAGAIMAWRGWLNARAAAGRIGEIAGVDTRTAFGWLWYSAGNVRSAAG